MRWYSITWMLLAIVTAIHGNERTKRTLPFINTFASSLLGIQQTSPVADNVLLYKIPGYDDVLLKVTPQKVLKKIAVPMSKNIVLPNNPLIKLIHSHPYNKTCEDSKSGFQKLVNLLKLGIHNKKKILRKLFAPPMPKKTIIFINDQTKHVIQEYAKSSPALGLKYTETVEVDSKRIAAPMPAIVPVSKQVKISQVVQPKYSYKQASKDGTMMSYEFEDNPNVIVTEAEVIPELPAYIKSRFEEVVSAVRPMTPIAPGVKLAPPAVITEDIRFGSPIISGNIANIVSSNPRPPIRHPMYPPAFVRLQNSGYFEGEELYGPPIVVEEGIPELLRTRTYIYKLPGPKGNVNVKISNNERSTKINNKMSPTASPSKSIGGTNSNTSRLSMLGSTSNAIPPPPSLSSVNSNSVNRTTSGQATLSQRSVNSVNDEVSDNTVVSNEHGSSFVYKQINNNNLQPLDIGQAGYNRNTNLETRNDKIGDISDRMSNYFFVPPLYGNIEPPPNDIGSTLSFQDNNKIINTGALKLCLESGQVSSQCPEPFSFRNNESSLKNSPIVVLDNTAPFVYKQTNADGSSISMKGSQNDVVVDVKEIKTVQNNRGDIPEVGVYK